MSVTFLMKTPPGGKESVEYVSIKAGGSLDTIVRRATDRDRLRYASAYRAFKEPPPAPLPPEPPTPVATPKVRGKA